MILKNSKELNIRYFIHNIIHNLFWEGFQIIFVKTYWFHTI